MLSGLDPDVVVDITKNLGVLGVLAWFLYYTVKFTLPGIQKEHTDVVRDLNVQNARVINDIVSDHRATITDITVRFDNRLKEERIAWQQDLAAERNHRKQEISQLTEAIRNIHRKVDEQQ